MDTTVITIISGIIISIIGYFLNRTMRELDKVRDTVEKNSIKISLLENNHLHLTDKFDQLYDAVKDLTREIQKLNVAISKKKDM